MKRPLTAGGGGAIVHRPSQMRKPLSTYLSQKKPSKPDSTKHSSQQRQPLPTSVPIKQEAAVRPRNVRNSGISPGQAKRPVVGLAKCVSQSKPHKLTSIVTEASINKRKDLPPGKSLATRQNITGNIVKELDQCTLKDKPPTQASSLLQQAEGKDKENESSTKTVVKKRRSLIPTPASCVSFSCYPLQHDHVFYSLGGKTSRQLCPFRSS